MLILILHCRNIGNQTYVPTTWKILFDLEEVNETGNYTLQLALASATTSELQVNNVKQNLIQYYVQKFILFFC